MKKRDWETWDHAHPTAPSTPSKPSHLQHALRDLENLILILPPRCLHLDDIAAHPPEKRLADRRFIADLVINGVGFRGPHNHVGFRIIATAFFGHRHLRSDLHEPGASVMLLRDDSRILDFLLELQNPALDERLLVLR